MRLSRQLLVVSCLILLLPWVGCQYVRESEAVLQNTEVRALVGLNQAASAVFTSQEGLFPKKWEQEQPVAQTLYLPLLSQPIFLDGYDDDWLEWPEFKVGFGSSPDKLSYRVGLQGEYIYLFLSVQDREIKYATPGTDTADRILIYGNSGARYQVYASAPGSVQVSSASRYSIAPQTVNGYWRSSSDGYRIELRLPLNKFDSGFGFAAVDATANSSKLLAASFDTDGWYQPASPVHLSPDTQQLASIFVQPGVTVTVLNKDGWVIAKKSAEQSHAEKKGSWVSRAIYRRIVGDENLPVLDGATPEGRWTVIEQLRQQQGDSRFRWFQSDNPKRGKQLVVATPIRNADGILGYLVTDSSSEQYLLEADRSFNRVLLWGSISLLVIVGLMFGYASWLSLRIRSFSVQVMQLSQHDAVAGKVRESRVNDEIGSLIRQFNQLMQQVSENTEYLQTLARKLSHELRTPLAIIRSSLDNLSHTEEADKRTEYLNRASSGTDRLSVILHSMSEASRIENIISQSQFEHIAVDDLLTHMVTAYQQAFPNCSFQLSHITPIEADIMPELLVQLLDKLIENAADFCPPEGEIAMALRHAEEQLVISVENDGPLLPKQMDKQLFGNMVSVRKDEKSGHLGLGLYIARLIAQAHGGQIEAQNRADGTGVVFSIHLPISHQQ